MVRERDPGECLGRRHRSAALDADVRTRARQHLRGARLRSRRRILLRARCGPVRSHVHLLGITRLVRRGAALRRGHAGTRPETCPAPRRAALRRRPLGLVHQRRRDRWHSFSGSGARQEQLAIRRSRDTRAGVVRADGGRLRHRNRAPGGSVPAPACFPDKRLPGQHAPSAERGLCARKGRSRNGQEPGRAEPCRSCGRRRLEPRADACAARLPRLARRELRRGGGTPLASRRSSEGARTRLRARDQHCNARVGGGLAARHERAARLLGWSDAVYERLGAKLSPACSPTTKRRRRRHPGRSAPNGRRQSGWQEAE